MTSALRHKASQDDVFRDDMALIREDRVMSEAATLRLARAVAGFGTARNRDLPAHDLAAALLVLAAGLPAASRRRGDDMIGIVLDPRRGSAAALAPLREKARLAGLLPDALPGAPRLAEALSFGAFLAMSERGAGFAAFRDTVADLVAQPDDAGFLVCRKRLAAMADRYRRAHVLGAALDARAAALGRFLAGHAGPIDDDLALGFFMHLVEDGERPFLAGATTALFAALAVREEVQTRATVDRAIPIEDALDAVAAPATDGAGEADVALILAELPRAPKLLNASERERAEDVLRYAPWHRRLPLACLRAMAAGHWQMAIVNSLKRSRGQADIGPILADPTALDYAAWLEGVDGVIGRILDIGAMHLALSTTGESADPRTQEACARGRALLKAQHRAGFDRPAEELARSIAGAMPGLATVHRELAAFRAALAKRLSPLPLHEVEQKDRGRLEPLFRSLYSHETEALP